MVYSKNNPNTETQKHRNTETQLRCVIAVLSLCYRCVIAGLSLGYLLSLCYRCVIAVLSLGYRCVIAGLSLGYRWVIIRAINHSKDVY